MLLFLRLGLKYKGLDGRFLKKGLDEKKVFVVRDEVPYFSEALGLSLPSLSVRLALRGACPPN